MTTIAEKCLSEMSSIIKRIWYIFQMTRKPILIVSSFGALGRLGGMGRTPLEPTRKNL